MAQIEYRVCDNCSNEEKKETDRYKKIKKERIFNKEFHLCKECRAKIKDLITEKLNIDFKPEEGQYYER